MNKEQRIAELPEVVKMGEELKAAPFHLTPHMAYAIARHYALAAQAPLLERIAKLEKQNAELIASIRPLITQRMGAEAIRERLQSIVRYALASSQGQQKGEQS